MLCADGPSRFFHKKHVNCESCGDEPRKFAFGLLGGVLAVVALLLALQWWMRRWHREWWHRCVVESWRRGWQRFLRAEPTLRIVVSYYQTLAQLGDVLVVSYPRMYRRVIEVAEIVSFKLTSWLPVLPLECAFPELRDQLIFVLLVPLGVIAVAAAIGAADAFCTLPSSSISVASLLVPSLPFVLVWSYLVYPPITSLAFRALAPCECFSYDVPPPGTDETEVCFLTTDRAVVCSESSQGYHAPAPVVNAAIAVIIVWALGVPLLYVILLYIARKQLSRQRPATPLSSALAFLVVGFKPHSASPRILNIWAPCDSLLLTERPHASFVAQSSGGRSS